MVLYGLINPTQQLNELLPPQQSQPQQTHQSDRFQFLHRRAPFKQHDKIRQSDHHPLENTYTAAPAPAPTNFNEILTKLEFASESDLKGIASKRQINEWKASEQQFKQNITHKTAGKLSKTETVLINYTVIIIGTIF